MLQASAAGPSELAAQRLPGAMQPHAGVARRDPRFLGEASDAQAVQVHPTDRGAVLRFERFHQGHDAGTGHRFQLLIRVEGLRLAVGSKPLQRTAPGALAPVMVDDGVPKHAVEPGCG